MRSIQLAYSHISDAQDAIDFLDALKRQYADDDLTLSRLLRLIRDWLCVDESLDPTQAIIHIAGVLKKSPRLLYGLNAVLKQGYRIECNTDVQEVDYFILITPIVSQIYSTSNLNVVVQSSPREPYASTASPHVCQALIEKNSDPAWLTCLAQLFQHELDDPNVLPEYRRCNFKFLKIIADKGILPPSIFVNNISREGGAYSGGAFADIYKGRLKGKSVCLKVLRMFTQPPENRDKVYKEFSREVLVWSQLSHANILPFLGADETLFSPRFCLVSPWMSHGNIMDYLKTHRYHDRLTSICEIVEAIYYLHNLDPPVTHKDIKGANILINENLVCCLADFGIASIVELQTQRLGCSAPLAGSICWMPPEIMQPKDFPDQGPGLAGDIHALACTVFEIYTSKPPFAHLTNGASVMLAVLTKKRPSLPPSTSHWTTQEDEIWKLVEQCWSHEPSDRPGIETIRNKLLEIRKSLFHEQISRPTSLVSPSEVFSSPWTPDSTWNTRVKEWLDNEILAREHELWDVATNEAPTSQTPRPESPEERGTKTPRPSDRPPLLHLDRIPPAKFVHGLATPTTPSFDESDSDAQVAQRFRPKPKELTRIRGQEPITLSVTFPPEPVTPPKKSLPDILLSPKSPGLPTPPRTPVSDQEGVSARRGPVSLTNRSAFLQQHNYGMSTIKEDMEVLAPQEISKPILSRKRRLDEKDTNLAHSEAPSSRTAFNLASHPKALTVDKQLPPIQSNENTPASPSLSSFSQFSLSVPEHIVSVGTQAKESRRSTLPSLPRRSSLRPSPLRQSLQLPSRREYDTSPTADVKSPFAVGRSYTLPVTPSRLRTMSRPDDAPLVEESETEPSHTYIKYPVASGMPSR